MHVSPIDPTRGDAAHYIAHARRAVCERAGVQNPAARVLEPLSFARYFGLFVDGQRAGLAELIFYADAFKSYADCPWRGGYDLDAFCRHDQMVQLHTIHVEPQYQRTTSGFAFLCVALARYASSRHARVATAIVRSTDDYLLRMYERLQATKIGSLSHLQKVKDSGIDMTLYGFDIADLLSSRMTRRFERHSASMPLASH